MTTRCAAGPLQPERLSRAHRLADGRAGDLQGVIDVVEPTGPDTMVTIRHGDTTLMARLPPHSSARSRSRIALAVDTGRISLFDPATERRLLTGILANRLKF